MNLTPYLIQIEERVKTSDIRDNGKDANGFYLPVRTLLFRHLQLFKDLHEKPAAQPMLARSWKFIVEHVPPEWLIMNEETKAEMKKILGK